MGDDDLLGSIIDGGGAAKPADPARPLSTADRLVAEVVGALRRPHVASKTVPADTGVLLRLDPTGWRTLVRYLPSELMVPLVGGLPVALADRLVRSLDADGQAWLIGQSAALEQVTPEAHAAAWVRMRAILDRLTARGRIVLADGPVSVGPAPASEPPVVRRETPVRCDEALIQGLAGLVRAARSRPDGLDILAAGIDHPVLTEGLRLIVAGADAQVLVEAVREAEEALVARQRAACAAIREALLAIRFGEGPAEFLRRMGQR